MPTALVFQYIQSTHSQMCRISYLKIQAMCLTSDLGNMHFRSHDVIRGRQQLLMYIFWLVSATGLKPSAMRLTHWDKSTVMQHGRKAGHDIDFRFNFKVDLSKSNYTSFDTARREKKKMLV